MALIIKNENDNYQKILIDRSFINSDGLYVATIVFKSKFERDKDKSRNNDFNLFFSNLEKKVEEIKSISDEIERSKEESKLSLALEIRDNFNRYTYKISGQETPSLSEAEFEKLKEYGFNRDWCEDPILVVRTDVIFLEEYNKQDFTLESFYNLLKKNLYTDKNGKLLVEDDL
jgi:hypothetical protein